MGPRSQLDLVINALVLMRKAQSAVDAALGLPTADRRQLEDQLEAVRRDLGAVMGGVAGAIPGATTLAKRREVKAAAGMVEFVARQGAAQLGAVAGIADALRGADSRTLANRIEGHLVAVGVAEREDLARALGVDPASEQFQEALERALGSGRAEWQGPGVYAAPQVPPEEAAEPLAVEDEEAPPAEEAEDAVEKRDLPDAVAELEASLAALGAALSQAEGADGSDGGQTDD